MLRLERLVDETDRLDAALLTPDDSRIPFFDELGWKRAYADDYAVIYTRDR